MGSFRIPDPAEPVLTGEQLPGCPKNYVLPEISVLPAAVEAVFQTPPCGLDNPVKESSLSDIPSHLFISSFSLLLLRSTAVSACPVDILGHKPTWTPRPPGPGRRQHSEMRQLHIWIKAGFVAFTGASGCGDLDDLGLPLRLFGE